MRVESSGIREQRAEIVHGRLQGAGKGTRAKCDTPGLRPHGKLFPAEDGVGNVARGDHEPLRGKREPCRVSRVPLGAGPARTRPYHAWAADRERSFARPRPQLPHGELVLHRSSPICSLNPSLGHPHRSLQLLHQPVRGQPEPRTRKPGCKARSR
jgi:hypothetical protein